MATTTKDQLLLHYRHADTLAGVTRDTVKKLAEQLGFNETQTVHYALARLAKEILPKYEPDDGPLTERQLDAIRRAVPQKKARSVKSSLV